VFRLLAVNQHVCRLNKEIQLPVATRMKDEILAPLRGFLLELVITIENQLL
jgi:hypothetical protein